MDKLSRSRPVVSWLTRSCSAAMLAAFGRIASDSNPCFGAALHRKLAHVVVGSGLRGPSNL